MDVTFEVQPRLLNLGETATATLVFHGVRSAPSVEFPQIPGLQITGAGQMLQTINGRNSVRLNYRIFPTRPGTHTIGPYNLEFNGETVTIPEVALEVRAKSGEAHEREMLFARIELPEQPPFVHQVFEVTLHLYSLPNVELARDVNLLGGFPESGFALSGFEELQTVREEVDGQFYNLRRFRARGRALTAGTFTFQPALRVGVVDRNARRQRRDPFFDGFFDDPFGRVPTTPVSVPIPSETLTVQAIPEQDRPAEYAGAVGHFEFGVDVRPRKLEVGQPITVSLNLRGAGNIAAARPPVYHDSDMFKAYEARLVGNSPEPAAIRGEKTFEQVVLPRTENLKELPALKFSFFDPEAAQYRTISAGPFPLEVQPSENGANSMMLQIPGANVAGGNTLVLGSDIVYLKSAPARWINTSERAARARLLLGLHALPPLVLAGLFVATRRRRRLASDIALARRQKAPRSARAALRKAEAALRQDPTPGAVFEPLVRAVSDYFGHRFNLPPGAVEAPLILGKLRTARTDETTLAQWEEFFALADQVRYASSGDLPPEKLESWVATVTTLLRKAERIRM